MGFIEKRNDLVLCRLGKLVSQIMFGFVFLKGLTPSKVAKFVGLYHLALMVLSSFE